MSSYPWIHRFYQVEELENAAQGAEDKAARAMAEVSRLMAELSNAQEGTSNAENSRALLAKQVHFVQPIFYISTSYLIA